MLQLSREKEQLKVVNDQIGCPTYTIDLSKCIMQLMETNKYGIYHVSNTGSCSWFEFAKEIFRQMKKSIKLEPCTTDEFPRKQNDLNIQLWIIWVFVLISFLLCLIGKMP